LKEATSIKLIRVTLSYACLLIPGSCATRPHPSPIIPATELPADVTINKNAGRWGMLFVTLQSESGEELPFVLDTGSSWTVLDKSLVPSGERLRTISLSTWSVAHKADVYAAPKLYLGGTRLMISNIVTCDVEELGPGSAKGILGMDCLKHYCTQLDFEAGRIRFLDGDQLNAAELGQAFPLTLSWNLPFVYRASLKGGKDTHSLIDSAYDIDGRIENRAAPESGSTRLRLPECVWDGKSYTNVIVRQGKDRSVVGLRFLARHLVTLDFPKRTMYLKQRRIGPLADGCIEDAIDFLMELKVKGQLPGSSKEDHGSTWANPHSPDTVDVRKKGDMSTYHYSVSRASNGSSWKLQKAWRTDQSGRTLEEYSLPEF